jgi:hypothetical protein
MKTLSNALKNKLTTAKEVFCRLLFLVSSLILFLPPHWAQAQACVPTGGSILSSGDDDTAFWVDGNAIAGDQTYCQPPCVPTPIAVPLADFTDGTSVVFAAATTNINPSLVFSSYELDISCAGGGDVVISSAAVTGFYYDSVGGTGSCGVGNPPPNDLGSNTWYDTSYNPTTNVFNNSSVPVVGTTYVTQVFNPITGTVIPFSSYNASGSAGSCGIIYWRQAEVLPTPVATLGPTNVTVTDTLIAGSVTQSGGNEYASYLVTVCNSGAPIQSVPVTLTSTFSNIFQGNSNGCPVAVNPQSPQYQCGTPYQVIFPTGLAGGGACEPVTVNTIIYSYSSNYPSIECDPVTDIGVVDWAAASQPVSSNVVTWNIPCPTETPTPVPPVPSLTKTTNGPTSNWNESGTQAMTITVCNAAGAGPGSTGITVADNVTNNPGWSYAGPWYSQQVVTVAGSPVTINITNQNFPNLSWVVTGLPGGDCVPIPFNVVDYSPHFPADNCQVVTDVGEANWASGGPVMSNSIAITVQCPTTPTNTATVTSTNTPTNTPTVTNTNTSLITSTFTDTPTVTLTDTITNTPTITDTATPTNTPTLTGTSTPTDTVTNTVTVTNTNTATNTPTITSTLTATDTSTLTSTVTATNTITNTATITATNTTTNTPTVTATFTSSPTPFAVVTMAKNVSKTTANPGDAVTYSIGITVTGTGANNVVVTDTLPSGLTFVSFGTIPAGTVTAANPPNLQWTLPSPLAIGTYQLTYLAQVNKSLAGEKLTNNAQLTFTGLPAPITSNVSVQIPGQYTVNINIYNSAGEVVKTIPALEYSGPINSFTLQPNNQITTLQGPGSTVQIFYNGTLIATWNGTNNSENPVTNGIYQIKVGSTSSSGFVTSVTQQVIVNRQLSNITATIYNSAGEVVRILYNVVSDASDVEMTNVNLSSSVISPGVPTSGSMQELLITVVTSGTPVVLTWDGTNNSATVVTPGTYTIQLHWDNGQQGGAMDISRTVSVIGGVGASGVVVAEPNVLQTGQMMTTFNGIGITNATALSVKIYTIAGQMVPAAISQTPGAAIAQWTATGVASGLYLASVEVLNSNGGVIEHQTLKILLLH